MPDPTTESGLLSPLSKNNLILLCLAFITAVFLYLVEALPDVMTLLAATLLVAYLLMEPVLFVENKLSRLKRKDKPLFSRNLRRTLAIALVYLLFGGLIVISIVKIIPPLLAQIEEFIRNIPVYVERFQDGSHETAHTLPPAQQWLLSTNLVQKAAMTYTQYLSRAGEYLLSLGTSALSTLIYSLTMLVLVFILLQDGAKIKKGFIELLPSRWEILATEFIHRFHRHASRFIQAQALISLLGGSMIYLLLMLMDNKYALLLGVFYGLISLIPIVGAWIGLLTLVIFTAFGDHPDHIAPLVLYVITFYCFKAYWLSPRIYSRHTDIHPIIFLIMLLVSIRVAGIPGVLLAFPLASVLGVLFDYLREAFADDKSAEI